jgi:hypothetical protein
MAEQTLSGSRANRKEVYELMSCLKTICKVVTNL